MRRPLLLAPKVVAPLFLVSLLLVSSLVAGAPTTAAAQEEPPPLVVYEAYFKINFADLEEWTTLFREQIVPVLAELREEGAMEGWAAYEHVAGGEYNWRLAIRGPDWASFDTFWTKYFERVPETAQQRTGELIEAHHDEIWRTFVQDPPATPTEGGFLYTSTFQVGLADMSAWEASLREESRPILRELRDEGLVAGWVFFTHDTGPRHNSKVLFFFDDWDQIDDFWETYLDRLGALEGSETMMRMIRGHGDQIWTLVSDSAGSAQ